MPSKEEKRRRARLVEAMVQKDTEEAIERMPISFGDLAALFDHLDEELGEHECDHTKKMTKAFLERKKLNTEAILPQMIETGADGLELDYKTDVNKAYELMHDKCTFLGNVDPSGILALGSTNEVRKATMDLLEVFSKTNRFILNAGCALPPGTPEENVREFIRTAREFG